MHVATEASEPGARRILLVLETGEEVIASVARFARERGIQGATFTGLGALRNGVLAYWDAETRAYEEHPLDEQMEVASLTGNVAVGPGATGIKVHAHAVLGTRDASARAGHVIRGIVHPTLEILLVETASPLAREKDDVTGLPLLKRA